MLRSLGAVAIEAARAWTRHRANRLAAAFAFYTLLSIAPALVVVIGIAGIFLDQEAVRTSVLAQASESFGPKQADFLQEIILATASRGSGLRATLIGLPILMVAATAMFAHLHEATNVIWGTFDPRPGFRGAALQRLFAVGLLLLTGVVLIAWLVLDSSLGYATGHARSVLQPAFPLYRMLSFGTGIVFWGFVFALFLRALPATPLSLRTALPGGIVMAVGFGLGRNAMAVYFSYTNFSAAYGAAGALVVLLVWTYFTGMLFFYCVEITRLLAASAQEKAPQPDGGGPDGEAVE